MIAVVVAVVGILIIRFSHASGSVTYTAQNGIIPIRNAQVFPTVGNGYNDSAYTAYPSVVGVGDGGVAKAQEDISNVIGNAPSGVIKVCWTYYSSQNASKVFTLEIDHPTGQIAVQPNVAIYAPSTQQTCITHDVTQSAGILIYTMAMQSTSNGGRVGLVQVTRSTLSVQSTNPSAPPQGPVGGIPNPPPTNPNIQILNFPAGQLTTICGYANYKNTASVCPQNISQWQYIGLNSSWVGTWAQNQARGVTHEHDVGYWKWGNFCGVKSHVTGDPLLPKVDESNGVVHFYLVGCPTGQDILNFKRNNAPARWNETPTSSYPNGCWINGKLETSPASCKKVADRGGNVVPR